MSAPQTKRGEIPSIRTVIFDLFGTLVPVFSFARHEHAMADMARAVDVPAQRFRELWVSTFEDRLIGRFRDTKENVLAVCHRMGLAAAPSRVLRAVAVFCEFTRQSLEAPVATLDLLDYLRQAGVRCGLVSNCSPEVPRLWKQMPLASRIDATVFSCVVGRAKPEPETYRAVCQALSVQPEHCLYVGDGSSRELTGARNLGMRAVLLRTCTHDTYDARRPDVEEWTGTSIDSLQEVAELLGLKR